MVAPAVSPRADAPDVPSRELMIARYHALLSLITGDAELIWIRYNALLTANAIVAVVMGAMVGAVATRGTIGSGAGLVLIGTAAFGLALCYQWWRLTHRGWQLQHAWVREAKAFDWEGLTDPFAPYDEWCASTRCGAGEYDWIARYAKRVIFLFALAYVGLLIYGLTIVLPGLVEAAGTHLTGGQSMPDTTMVQGATQGPDWTLIAVAIISACAGILGAVATALLNWLLGRARERAQREHERATLWADYALRLTERYYDSRQRLADASGVVTPVNSPVKLWRELFRGLQEYAKTGEWDPKLRELGLLDIAWLNPTGQPPSEEFKKYALRLQNMAFTAEAGSAEEKKGDS
jgi:hypothetical protein